MGCEIDVRAFLEKRPDLASGRFPADRLRYIAFKATALAKSPLPHCRRRARFDEN